MSYEIEVKYRVSDVKKIHHSLLALGAVEHNSSRQLDIVYLPAEMSDFSEMKTGTAVLRQRDSDGLHYITLKKRTPGSSTAKEVEFAVDASPGTITDFFTELGYHEVVRVNKHRTSYQLGEHEICLDSVDDLGDFIEIEIMSEDEGDIVPEELRIKALGEKLGLNADDIVNQRYDTMILAAINNLGVTLK